MKSVPSVVTLVVPRLSCSSGGASAQDPAEKNPIEGNAEAILGWQRDGRSLYDGRGPWFSLLRFDAAVAVAPLVGGRRGTRRLNST